MRVSGKWPLIPLVFVLLVHHAVGGEDFEEQITRTINAMKISLRNLEKPPPALQPPPAAPPSPPVEHPLQQRSLIEYCRKLGHPKIQLGPCSPTFLVCEPLAIRFEHCPTGQVFVDEACRSTDDQPTCFDSSSNQLNHATEKLVDGTGFCRTNSPQGFVHVAADANQCSRQALICAGMAGVLTVACPKGHALRARDLACVPAAPFCHFAHKAQVQPIKTHLEALHCNQQKGPNGSPMGVATAAQSQRCQDWNSKVRDVRDARKGLHFLRPRLAFRPREGPLPPTRPQDNCPAIFSCRGFEWRLVPFGICRPEFIFCRGLTPVQFRCRPEFVLKDEKCVHKKELKEECEPPASEHPPCAADERKPDSANCTRFYQCDAKDDGQLFWRHYECPKNEGYDPHRRACSSDFKCGNECEEGQSFVVSCYEYFRCHNNRFQSFVCPSKSRYSKEEKKCVFDPKCRHRDEQEKEEEQEAEETCKENSFVKSKDCISYGVCKDSILHWKPCQLPSGKLHPQCPDCSQEHNPPSSGSGPKNPDDDSNFSQTECTDGAVVIGKNDCSRFMKCYAGHWQLVECPNEKFFSRETQACTAEECEPSGVFIPSGGAAESIPEWKPPAQDSEECNDEDCCDADSPKLAIPTDCQRFLQCDKKTRRYEEMQCPYSEHFSTKEQQCVEGGGCGDEETSECPTGAVQAMPKCGYARLCLDGKWSTVRCKKQMAFLNGECSKEVSCKHAESETEIGDECHDGETKRHPFSCNKYLVCDHGIFVEKICSYGALFNHKSQRCDLNFECDYENQPKCYEGQLKANKHNCHLFLRCVEGAFVEETCPGGRVFDDALKKCKKGKCKGEESSAADEEPTVSEPISDEDGEDEEEHTGGKKPSGPPKGKCTEGVDASGYRRDRNVCSKFYQCANGVWVPKDCPSGTVFNTPLAVCDWPRNVPGCE
ncbi:Chitin binding Peritrophin-A domain protein [Aphelenchoides fujianensis]|nr:Chitin binding Peritrophin-A domain protein [Aphelenchoides fujianensis]